MSTARCSARTSASATTSARCVIYTRKSTDEGLDQAFNSLDAQREAAQAYIHSQAAAGWRCLPTRYDDGGFSGASLDRPALQRLLADIEAGHLDTVVVHRVDRLSRSLLDFAKMMEVFDRHGVGFVSVTQQFDSTKPMGRLTLHILLSFAQFERELIAERTRDKIAAARRKGQWSGGAPCLGYEVDAQHKRLVVHQAEAQQVRAIFLLYLRLESLTRVVQALHRRGWLSKRWISRRGHARGGRPFTRTSLQKLLTNVLYAGQVRHRGEVYAGQQPALVRPATWQRVQDLLKKNGAAARSETRLRAPALLAGLLRCAACACAMTPAHARKGPRRYRYYVCTHAQKYGWHTCPCRSVPAGAIERFVLDEVEDFRRRSGAPPVHDEGSSEPTLAEQARGVHRLVERVVYDRTRQKVTITFHTGDPTPRSEGAQA